MPAPDPWLKRQNAALKLRGHGVTLDVAGSRIRLRAVLPPKPGSPVGSPSKQQRISTGLSYPDEAAEAIRLAEVLGNALERHRIGLEAFDWGPWLTPQAKGADSSRGLTGREAIRATYEWWFAQPRARRPSDETWECRYEYMLRPIAEIPDLRPRHLEALVKSHAPGTSMRRCTGQAAVTLAKALGWPDDVISRIREASRGYSLRSVKRRELPSIGEIEALIDALKPGWQWPIGVIATYGCRPHEAMRYAEVLPTGLLWISDGKTGGRRALPLPPEWIDRWNLKEKRMPDLGPFRSDRDAGGRVTRMFTNRKLPFRSYDLRHAWAVRAISDPRISPSLAAKSMGHSLTMHSTVYQRWFDSNEMEAIHALITGAS